MLIEGRVAGLVFTLITIGTMLYGINKAKSKLPDIRRIAGLEAIDEAVGLAT